LNPSFDPAHLAARSVASGQHYPQGALYLVPTPIGNLADFSLRGLYLLALVDAVACEDTRHTQQLWRALGADTNRVRWLALHQHNENQASAQVLEMLGQGLRVAYMSDAGTPGISDPGSRLVAAVHRAGRRVVPLPGPSSVTTLLSASGAWATDGTEFVFIGFLPAKGAKRAQRLGQMLADPRPQCVLEAPHRITALAQDLQAGGERGLTVGRELSKQFEEIASMRCDQLSAWLEASATRGKGEFALVLHESLASSESPNAAGERELRLLLPHLPLRTAVQLAAEISGCSRNALYAQALSWQKDSD
jgi:16S rRNA (cytidine1402-2'-O)-methyltransferase